MPAIRVLALILMLATLGDRAAWAQTVDAEALIKNCDDVANPARQRGITSEMAAASHRVNTCLEGVFFDQVDILFDRAIYDRTRARADLDKARESILNLFRNVYMNHRGCPCGTMQSLTYPYQYRLFLENLIRQAIEQRNDYRVFHKKKTHEPSMGK